LPQCVECRALRFVRLHRLRDAIYRQISYAGCSRAERDKITLIIGRSGILSWRNGIETHLLLVTERLIEVIECWVQGPCWNSATGRIARDRGRIARPPNPDLWACQRMRLPADICIRPRRSRGEQSCEGSAKPLPSAYHCEFLRGDCPSSR